MFRADNMAYAWTYIKNMFGLVKTHDITYGFGYYVDTLEIIVFIVAIICCTPLFGKMLQQENKVAKAFVNIWLIILLLLSTSFIAASTYNPFIYFRF